MFGSRTRMLGCFLACPKASSLLGIRGWCTHPTLQQIYPTLDLSLPNLILSSISQAFFHDSHQPEAVPDELVDRAFSFPIHSLLHLYFLLLFHLFCLFYTSSHTYLYYLSVPLVLDIVHFYFAIIAFLFLVSSILILPAL